MTEAASSTSWAASGLANMIPLFMAIARRKRAKLSNYGGASRVAIGNLRHPAQTPTVEVAKYFARRVMTGRTGDATSRMGSRGAQI